MRFLGLLLLASILLSSPCFAESLVHPTPGKEKPSTSFWKASVIALVAASAADVHSSMGRYELNPMLRSADGRFGIKGIAIKSLIAGGAIGMQYLLVRKSPQASRYAAIANLGMTAMFTKVAIHNYGNAKPITAVKPSPAFDKPVLPAGTF
jgi:hypothetical protein